MTKSLVLGKGQGKVMSYDELLEARERRQEMEAAKSFEISKDHPELMVLLLKLNALEATLKERSTLILDERTPPFDLLRGVNNAQPSTGKEK